MRNAGRLGLIGIGLLGTALAERLAGAGFALLGYDRVADRRTALRALGHETAGTVAEVAGQCASVLLSLPDDDAVDQVVREVLDAEYRRTRLIVDTTTGDPQRTEARHVRLAEAAVRYVDATVVGSSEQMRRGEALLLVGGAAAGERELATLLEPLARQTYYLGASGSGARMKLVVNLVLGLNRAALAEGLALAASADLDLRQALEVLAAGPAASRIMDSKGAKMIEREFTPQARLAQHRKDVHLILQLAARSAIDLPLTETHRALLDEAVRQGWGELDNSAVIRVYERGTGPQSQPLEETRDDEDAQQCGS